MAFGFLSERPMKSYEIHMFVGIQSQVAHLSSSADLIGATDLEVIQRLATPALRIYTEKTQYYFHIDHIECV